jgi:predicted aspartyl protease
MKRIVPSGVGCGLAFAALASAWGLSADAADNCPPLQLITTVDMLPREKSVRPVVSVLIEHKSKYMLVDTGGIFTDVTRETADELGLQHFRQGVEEVGVNGETSDEGTRVSDFEIGRLHASGVDFMIAPKAPLGDEIAGTISPNMLRNYDVEFDFGGDKMSLLSQDHCEGKVIYWPASAVAVVPMRLVHSGHIIIPITLDGQTLDALLDTGATTTVLNLRVAEARFGFDANANKPVGYMPGPNPLPIYERKFSALGLEGIVIGNPTVSIMADLMGSPADIQPHAESSFMGSRLSVPEEARGLPQIILGMNELRHLHLYIAYKEQKLYITPADAPH